MVQSAMGQTRCPCLSPDISNCGPLGNPDDGIKCVQSNVRVENDPRWNQSNFLPSEMSRLQSKSTLPNFKHNTLVADVRSEPEVPDSMLSVCCTHIDRTKIFISMKYQERCLFYSHWDYFQTHLHEFQNPDTTHWVQFSFVLRGKLTFYEMQLLEGILYRLTICNSHVFLVSSLWYISKMNLTHLCSAGIGLQFFQDIKMIGRAQ